MDQQQLEYARLSGIEPPKAMLKAVEEAQGRLSNLVEKRSGLEAEKEGLEVEIQALIHDEAAAIVDGADGKKLAAKRKKAEERRAELGLLLTEIDKLEAAAKTRLSNAEEELVSFINDRLIEGRAEMKRQVEQAMEERGRNLNQSGQIFSAPPAKSSKSRIAVCEICSRDIGIFDPQTIFQSVTAAQFQKLPRFDTPPFNPRATIERFQCPFCGKKPWGEHDRILTNAGFYLVPEKKEGKKNG